MDSIAVKSITFVLICAGVFSGLFMFARRRGQLKSRSQVIVFVCFAYVMTVAAMAILLIRWYPKPNAPGQAITRQSAPIIPMATQPK